MMPSYLESDLNHSLNGKLTTSDIFSGLNLTKDMIQDFLLKSINITQKHPECEGYCDGSIRDIMGAYKNVHGYISLVICLFGTIANILNIMVLTRKEMTKTPINKILKWLSVADMFVMIEYIPFTVYTNIISQGKKDLSFPMAAFMLFHMDFTQILHTISILLTVTLAVWRYVAIRHPHGTFATFLLSHCNEAIILSFVMSPILCLPIYFLFQVKEKQDNGVFLYYVDAEEGTILYSINFWVHSVIIKLLPCCILTVISSVLIKVLCDASKRKIKLKEYSNPNSSSAVTNNNTNTSAAKASLNGNHRRSLKGERSSGSPRPDRTTMLLVAVLLLFLITEFPQGILGLLSISSKCFFVKCYHLFGEVMDLLALINAAIGFVLYGLMSKQFRTSFKMLFLKHRGSRAEMTRVTAIQSTCV